MATATKKRPRKYKIGERIQIPAAQIEFVHGGDTIWVHGPDGTTILRLKVVAPSFRVMAQRCDTSPVPHGDGLLASHVIVCIPDSKE